MADVEVCVVGAGLSGLCAAREVASAGRSVVVLEARDRVGGRTLNEPGPGGVPFELGAQFVGRTQRRLIAVARSVGVATFPTHAEGENVFEYRGRLHRFRGLAPRVNPAVLLDVAQAQRRLEAMIREVPVEAPWLAPRAAEWDRQTLREWVERHTATAGARAFFEIAVHAVWSVELEQLSLLHALFYAHSAGSLATLLETEAGAQEGRLEGGSALISERIAAELGDRVTLGAPVRRVADARRGALEVRADRVELTADRVIVAIPPHLVERIHFEPALPGRRAQLHQRMAQGTVAKCVAVYEEPFWRADGLSGQGGSDRGPVGAAFDVSPRSGRPGMMLGFVQARHARELGVRPAAERRAAVLESFARLFGARAREPVAYAERFWADEEWTRGCPAASFGPGGWTAHGPALRPPVGRVHWAGTETSSVWMGYMDGAVRAGERAAREVVRALG